MSYFPYMYDINRRQRVPVRYMAFMPENMYETMDPSNTDYFPKPRQGRQVTKDRFEVYLDVENYKPEELRVKSIDGFVIIEGKHRETQDQLGLIQRQFLRRCPVPQGYKPEDLRSQYNSDKTLSVTAKLVKINAGGSEVPVGSVPKGDKEKPAREMTDQGVQVELMEAGGSDIAEQALEEKDREKDQPSGMDDTSVASNVEPMVTEMSPE